jgi:hypothetical protein
LFAEVDQALGDPLAKVFGERVENTLGNRVSGSGGLNDHPSDQPSGIILAKICRCRHHRNGQAEEYRMKPPDLGFLFIGEI